MINLFRPRFCPLAFKLLSVSKFDSIAFHLDTRPLIKMSGTVSGEDVVQVKSVVLTEHGGFDNIKIQNWPVPAKCKATEVRVAVEYCGINFADLCHLQGRLLQVPTPYVMGLECSGSIVELGSEVTGFKVGDRVVCYKSDTGLFKESLVVEHTHCYVIPEDITNEIACALVNCYLTAYFSMCEMGNLRSGQTVLIHSAAGGVGWAATQLAKSVVKDVRILGTASASKHEDIAQNGVTVPLLYEECDTKLKPGEVDVVMDNISGENIFKSLALLKPLGRVILIGANCAVQQDEAKLMEGLMSLGRCSVPAQDIVMGNKTMCGMHLGMLHQQSPETFRKALYYMFSLYQEGLISPKIHTIYPFDEAKEAIKELGLRKNVGKVLLKVD